MSRDCQRSGQEERGTDRPESAGGEGYGLLDRALYIPERWFQAQNERRRKCCRIPEKQGFETKNQIALRMILNTIDEGFFPIKWIGCDAAFGCDHEFLDALPESVHCFAAVKGSGQIYLRRPRMTVPENTGKGRPFVHGYPSEPQVTVKSVAEDDGVSWEAVTLADGSKGKSTADVKVIRCVFCRASTSAHNYPPVPAGDGWLYIFRYANGDIKYFLSNAPETTPMNELHEAATLRWPIEQCFEACKSFLGMGQYECRTQGGRNRHMLMVMLAHGFIANVRLDLKKRAFL